MNHEWENIKDKYKAPFMVAVGWYILLSLILATIGVPYLFKTLGILLVGSIVGCLGYTGFVTVHDSIVDLHRRR